MGVDSVLYLSVQLAPEAIAFSLAKAMGEQPRLDSRGEENIFSGDDYIKTTEFAPASMWNIKVPKHDGIIHCRPSLHHSNEFTFGPCWLLMARSYVDVIAIFRTVAEKLGGLLVYRDYDNGGQLFQSLEDYGFTCVHEAA
ncbi:hypothetical protein LCGC14_2016380, partial [marine sediment metagenome]